ncbi:hypothetical protein LIER_20438 [Lithospermum erythrorhizon]|uniref:Protein FAR1-RELATED SEQUENCE n=1 Tax=Lithospermum erythrorhizon TaxID=34254 RepID=A0AAV3QP97_LITER
MFGFSHAAYESAYRLKTPDKEFDTEKDAYDFYNKYAAYVDFSVKKHNGHYKNKQIIDRVFACSCEGNRKDDKSNDDVKRPRAQTRKQDEDPNFSYAIQVDIDDTVTNIFWSDARMKIDYGHFGDVVCFDTTYRKNKEGRPFALFAGVNHHKQTTIFGDALLYDETTKTFEWLFQSFAKAMPREEPITIPTDDDPAMAKALASSWPKTYHRLCVWHMYKNATKHLSHVFDEYKSFT